MATNIELRSPDATICKVPCGKVLQEFAMRWNYIVRQRNRWSGSSDARQRQTDRLQTDLRNLGVYVRDLRKLAESGVVEVSIPYKKESQDWEARILPWEYVLSAATADYRDGRSLIVVRHLRRKGSTRTRTPKKLAILEAAPGMFRERYEFAAENSLVRSTLNSLEAKTFKDPTRDQLERDVKSFEPDIVHITGIDSRLGHKLLGDETPATQDGLFLSAGSRGMEEVNAVDLSKLLCAASHKPQFIGFNCWDSGSRFAALSVAAGANASLGFQHTFDDAVAEILFINFYRACHENNWDYLVAFLIALNSIASYKERIRGSSIILWSAKSLVQTTRRKGYEELESHTKHVKQAYAKRIETTRDADPELDQVSKLVQVSVVPKKYLNYSILHNGGGVLNEFILRFNPPLKKTVEGRQQDPEAEIGRVNDLQVTLELHVGTDTFPYRTKVSVGLTEERYDLANTDVAFKPAIDGNPVGGIRLPLTSNLIRSVNERMQTSVFIEVRWHDQILYRDTHSVWLEPIDEWSLTEEDIRWLPSFVQPRDPAVSMVIDSAVKYLKCLADYGGAGFDGYQSVDPDARGLAQWDGIDRQVQAIWAALVFDQRLNYINPPPSYTDTAQRLRTPRQIIAQNCGTCVDLSILLASCLEWVEIYPVIFLLDDHAFPGYWRSYAAYCRFLEVDPEGLDESFADVHPKQEIPTPRWISDRSTYREIKSYVDAGELVPMESVLLTNGSGFADSLETALEYFAKKRHASFHSMVDIGSAREDVTPLPLLDYSQER